MRSGAKRAAERISVEALDKLGKSKVVGTLFHLDVAEQIIEQETRASDLLEALKGLLELSAWEVEETVRRHGEAVLQSDIRCAYRLIKELEAAAKRRRGAGPDLSAAGPYATKEDRAVSRELKISVKKLRAQRAAEDK